MSAMTIDSATTIDEMRIAVEAQRDELIAENAKLKAELALQQTEMLEMLKDNTVKVRVIREGEVSILDYACFLADPGHDLTSSMVSFNERVETIPEE